MRKLMKILLSSILILSGLMYLNLNALKSSMSDMLSIAGSSEVLTEIKEMTSFEPVLEQIPTEYKVKAQRVIDKASKSSQIDDILMDQSSVLLNDIINNTNTFDQSKLTNDIFEVIDEFSYDIEKATNNKVSKENIKTKFENRIVGYNFTTHYEKVVNNLQNKINDKQKQSLKIIKLLVNNIDLLKTISLVTVALSSILLAIFSLKTLLPVAIIAFVLTLLNNLLLPTIFSNIAYKMTGQTLDLVMDEKVFTLGYSYIGGLFVLGFLGKMFKND